MWDNFGNLFNAKMIICYLIKKNIVSDFSSRHRHRLRRNKEPFNRSHIHMLINNQLLECHQRPEHQFSINETHHKQ